jgi:hypothetical protein
MTLTSIPTEYKGIRFDSKSEAVFARLLDLNGISWEYQHPIRHAKHDWDFLLWLDECITFPCCDGIDADGDLLGNVKTYHQFVKTLPCLVELKPRKPNATYMERLVHEPRFQETRAVIWGNPWGDKIKDGAYGDVTYMCRWLMKNDYAWSDECPVYFLTTRFSESKIDEAISFRFDVN